MIFKQELFLGFTAVRLGFSLPLKGNLLFRTVMKTRSRYQERAGGPHFEPYLSYFSRALCTSGRYCMIQAENNFMMLSFVMKYLCSQRTAAACVVQAEAEGVTMRKPRKMPQESAEWRVSAYLRGELGVPSSGLEACFHTFKAFGGLLVLSSVRPCPW